MSQPPQQSTPPLLPSDAISDLDKVLGDTDIPYRMVSCLETGQPLNIKMSGPDQGYLEIDEDLLAGGFYFEI